MRYLLTTFSLILTLLACNDESKQNVRGSSDSTSVSPVLSNSKKSLPSETTRSIGNTIIRINYHAPAVRGRVIWGGLVAYDSVWVTGAHSATSIEIDKDFMIGNTTIPAGKYALFTIPGKQDWMIIINKNWKQHLADDYDQGEDVARIHVKPQSTTQVTERLKYEIDQTDENSADIIVNWEKIRVAFPITIK